MIYVKEFFYFLYKIYNYSVKDCNCFYFLCLNLLFNCYIIELILVISKYILEFLLILKQQKYDKCYFNIFYNILNIRFMRIGS